MSPTRSPLSNPGGASKTLAHDFTCYTAKCGCRFYCEIQCFKTMTGEIKEVTKYSTPTIKPPIPCEKKVKYASETSADPV